LPLRRNGCRHIILGNDFYPQGITSEGAFQPRVAPDESNVYQERNAKQPDPLQSAAVGLG
jgi:hypothetical protein